MRLLRLSELLRPTILYFSRAGRRRLEATPRCDLDAPRNQSRVLTNGYEQATVNQRTRGSGVKGQLKNAAAARSPQFRPYENQAPL
jgi:hypothetical protein